VAAIGGGLMVYRDPSAPALYTLSTAAGRRQSAVIPGAARVELNGDTRVTLDRNDPRFARLERGEAVFTVEHDPARPFQLHIGRTVVTDIGTVFDAEQDGPVTRLDVAEGAVRVATAAGSTTVTAGQTVTIEEDGTATVRRSDGGLRVGGWRQGQIDFADISLGRLAARLHRASGARIVVAPDIFDRRVSGSIILGSNPDAALKDIGPLLGISIDRSPDGWIWSGRVRAKPA
jgi:transmembrane sensor